MEDLKCNPISVIGNAESIFNNQYGELIDKNITIRFNRAEILNSKCQGSKWDYLVSSEINTFEKYNKENPPFHSLIFSPIGKEFEYKLNKVMFKTNIFRLPLIQSEQLKNKLSAPPSTGLQILYYLDSIGNKDVSIFGFDFKKTKTFYEIRNKGKHDFKKEKELIFGFITKNNWKIYLDTE